MDLLEQYQTLLRRGMPEREEFVVEGDAGNRRGTPDEDSEWACWWADDGAVCCGDEYDGEHHSPAAARDLITMHASRHFSVTPIPTSRGKWYTLAGPIDDDDYGDEYWFGGDDFHEQHKDGIGDTALDAILAATKHLEPTHA